MAAPSIAVVIPIHNEAAYLPEALPRLFAELAEVSAPVTVTFAENGSTDGTGDLVRSLSPRYPGIRLLELAAPDYGAAMRAGFLASQGDWVVNFDIDYFSGDFLRQVLERSDESDVVVASKRAPGSEDHRGRLRRLATWGFNLILRLLLGSKVSDTHGMKALRRAVVDEIAPRVVSRQDLFDTELVIRAERAGYRITEVPVIVDEQRQARSSLLRRVPRTLRGVWRIRRSLRNSG